MSIRGSIARVTGFVSEKTINKAPVWPLCEYLLDIDTYLLYLNNNNNNNVGYRQKHNFK
jgi:hypothetical protein